MMFIGEEVGARGREGVLRCLRFNNLGQFQQGSALF